jgi:hypothetical protein
MNIHDMMEKADEYGEHTFKIEQGYNAGIMKQIVENSGYGAATDGVMFTVIAKRKKPIDYGKTGTV